MTESFRLLMIGAMYENGGNTTHRFLDGHPDLAVYPFESQLGTRYVDDLLASMFPLKYRWPEFLLGASAHDDYRAIIDEECKVRARTPQVSKFRDRPFDFSDDERRERFVDLVAGAPRTRAGNVAAFFRATFDVWRDHRAGSDRPIYVGYSPIVTVDYEKILSDLPGAHVLHVVRNPWSAFADTCRRPVPLGVADYMLGWTTCQHAALVAAARYPGRVQVLRFEDLVADPPGVLANVLASLGVAPAPALAYPTWNGQRLDQVYPWGTIRHATTEANRSTARELSSAMRSDVTARAGVFLDALDYRSFL